MNIILLFLAKREFIQFGNSHNVRYNLIGGGHVSETRTKNIYENARMLSGLTREQAANKLEISESYLEKIEYNIRVPGRDTLIKMSKLYSKTLDELCTNL
jgi:DNA-binding XRE family transcriptional regulator